MNGGTRTPKIVFPKRTPFEKIRSGIELFFSLINAPKNELRTMGGLTKYTPPLAGVLESSTWRGRRCKVKAILGGSEARAGVDQPKGP